MRNKLFSAGLLTLAASAGCTINVDPTSDPAGAAIIGSVVAGGASPRQAADECPAIRVELNGVNAALVFDDACGFLIENVAPTDHLEIRVVATDLGLAGSVEVLAVTARQMIEISVEISDDSLTITVTRQQEPEVTVEIPAVVSANNAMFEVSDGLFESDLRVTGNNFTLVGQSGDDCNSSRGWTVLAGDVTIEGNNATFSHVMFDGAVQVLGNNARFINTCFDGELIIFGNNAELDPSPGSNNADDDNGDDDD